MYQDNDLVEIISQVVINKGLALNTAIAIQIFEWFNAWLIIIFQQSYDITEIPIEKRKFQPQETKCKTLCMVLLGLIYLALNGVAIYLDIIESHTNSLLNAQKFKGWALFTLNTVNLASALVTLPFFSVTAYKKHRTAWNEYKVKFSIQAVGILTTLVTNQILNLILLCKIGGASSEC